MASTEDQIFTNARNLNQIDDPDCGFIGLDSPEAFFGLFREAAGHPLPADLIGGI